MPRRLPRRSCRGLSSCETRATPTRTWLSDASCSSTGRSPCFPSAVRVPGCRRFPRPVPRAGGPAWPSRRRPSATGCARPRASRSGRCVCPSTGRRRPPRRVPRRGTGPASGSSASSSTFSSMNPYASQGALADWPSSRNRSPTWYCPSRLTTNRWSSSVWRWACAVLLAIPSRSATVVTPAPPSVASASTTESTVSPVLIRPRSGVSSAIRECSYAGSTMIRFRRTADTMAAGR